MSGPFRLTLSNILKASRASCTCCFVRGGIGKSLILFIFVQFCLSNGIRLYTNELEWWDKLARLQGWRVGEVCMQTFQLQGGYGGPNRRIIVTRTIRACGSSFETIERLNKTNRWPPRQQLQAPKAYNITSSHLLSVSLLWCSTRAAYF